MSIITLYHFWQLPQDTLIPQNDKSFSQRILQTSREIISECRHTPHLTQVILFLLVFNAAEAQLLKVVPLFFMSKHQFHGLQLSDFNMGIIQILGVLAIIGGAFSLSYCLKKWSVGYLLKVSMLFLIVTNLVYWPMASHVTLPLWLTAIGYGLAQLMFGFANSAYMAYLMYLVEGRTYKAAFYALGTAVMSLSFLIFGMVSGLIKSHLSYQGFFIWIVTLSVLLFIYTTDFVHRSQVS